MSADGVHEATHPGWAPGEPDRHRSGPMTIRIEPLNSTLVEPAKAVIREVWKEHFSDHPEQLVRSFLEGSDGLEDLDEWDHVYRPPKGRFLVVLDEWRVVGTGGIREAELGVGELTRMFLKAPYRGQGVGRQMAEALIDFAREAGYASVRLGSNKRLEASHRLYESLGFRKIPAYEAGGDRYAYYMELTL